MLQGLAVTGSLATSPASAGALALGSEKNASSPESATGNLRAPSSTPALASKLRSCVICRQRKVRCDKLSPCSNCRRANVACVLPSTDRPPRWARRLERLTNNAAASGAVAQQGTDPGVGRVMDRLRKLEGLVKDLSGQLEQAHAAASSAGGSSSEVSSPGSSAHDRDAKHQRHASPDVNTTSVQKQFGRLVIQDASRSRYVSSGFWSRVNDELEGLKMDTRDLAGEESNSSEDELSPEKIPSTQELGRTPSERYAFLFRHNLSPSAPDLREFHPLPSQIPFILDVFSENVNLLIQIVHMPTITKMFRDSRGSGMMRCTPAIEALMFSICYAAITSMEEDDVMINFDSSKTDLNLKYRYGLEHALAKADFLNNPDIVLVQAFALFLLLVRRHDNPRFVWMMTGLAIRMGQYLGLQRDGAHFEHLTPFEIEMRRKVWWGLVMLDLRASEDQGTDLTIPSASFDTKIPLNINDEDISPESKQVPTERDGFSDMSFARSYFETGDIMRQMMAPGVKDDAAGLQTESHLLDKLHQKFEQGYGHYTAETANIAHWVGVTIARLVIAKMTLITFLPVLFSFSSEHASDGIRTKLLVSAIEVAEYNHALNAEQACRQWRWIYQTYTHWHSIVYLMLEISRRPWSPIVERAWVALHSSWLIPARPIYKNSRLCIPLRKLMNKARRHRNAELSRLRADPQSAARLETEDEQIPLPSSSGPFSTGSSVENFRERWRQLVAMPVASGDDTRTSGFSSAGYIDPLMHTACTSQPTARFDSFYSQGHLSSNTSSEPTYFGTSSQQAGQPQENTGIGDRKPASTTNGPDALTWGETVAPSHNPFPSVPADCSDGRAIGPDSATWLWTGVDPSVDTFSNFDVNSMDVNMDFDGEVDWLNWVESVKGMEMDAGPISNG